MKLGIRIRRVALAIILGVSARALCRVGQVSPTRHLPLPLRLRTVPCRRRSNWRGTIGSSTRLFTST